MKCIPCEVGGTPLSRAQIKTYASALDSKDPPKDGQGWRILFDEPKAGRLVRTYEFDDFAAAMKFVNKVADVAEENGHHPNIWIHSWNKVELELFTHKIGGLSEADFVMAAKVDTLGE